MKKPELLAPGGSFLAAYHAFEAGADGVYLGLREFSARAAAPNFTLDQLRRIRQLAADRDRRIYVTINTVVRNDELDRLRQSLTWLQALRVDGVIVQDLGVCDLVHREFPGLALHASTQMGVYNESGLQVARDLGVRRVILSRELPLERIRQLRQRAPDMELEVFIHGALCYSFSGSCLASWALTGRSANRGECAQICRSHFVPDTAGEGPGAFLPAGPGHLFSTRDLFAGGEVRELARLGVDALKIEGRMKSPEYVRYVTRLYRELLDSGDDLPAPRLAELARDAQLGFSRRTTSGWLHSPLGADLVEKGAPGHRGAVLGTVRRVTGRRAELLLEGDLSRRDGAGWLLPGGSEMAAFSVQSIRRAGRAVPFARRGDVVEIELPPEASPTMPTAGQEMRHLSSRSRDLPQPREASFAVYKIPVDMDVRIDAAGTFRVRAEGFPEFSRAITVSDAETRRPFFPILSALLRESGASAFRPGAITLSNESGHPDDGIFARPAELKRLKNELFAYLDRTFEEKAAGRSRGSRQTASPGPERSPLGPSLAASVSHRELLSPPGQAPVPFVDGNPDRLRVEALAETAGLRWLPLPPILVDEAAWIEAVHRLAGRHPSARIAVGLNNVSHVALARQLQGDQNVSFFADFFLYMANDAAVRVLSDRVPRLLFAYEWIEGPRAGPSDASGPVPIVRIADGFEPPLFVSLGCFQRHAVHGGSCAEDCPRELTGEVRQGRNRFRLVVRDCVTYLFRASPIRR